MPLRGFGVVVILRLDRTLVSGFGTAVADERSFFYSRAMFPFETATNAVAAMTGAASGITDDQLVAGICLFAGEPVDAEVVRVVETAPVPRIDTAMLPDFSGDG